MDIEIELTNESIANKISSPLSAGAQGAWIEFRGIVRGEENDRAISALEYEAYSPMAESEMRHILEMLANKFPCIAAKIIHRIGIIPVGETAIYVGIAAAHRGEAISLLAEFMDRLKQDVPIWKCRALPVEMPRTNAIQSAKKLKMLSLDEAFAEIKLRSQPLPAVRVSLNNAIGRVLRETVCARENLPDCDRSTRDGYAIQQNDGAEYFQIVDTRHAADWRPRQLKSGDAVRVATGAAMPCDNLRVVMQEHVERSGDQIKIIKYENGLNIRKRGEDMCAGQPLVQDGVRLDAGRLALLATAGCARPLVNQHLRVVHLTTGDEIISPEQTPKPGQIRDSNSILIRGLLQNFPCDIQQIHLPEDFERAKQVVSTANYQLSIINVLLVSGGASVGDKDFTRPLLEWLGYEIIFDQVNVRPGRPLIFGMTENRIAFGLPGNPLSHFVCFHLFVATALAKLVGERPKQFLRDRLATELRDAANPRETFWPAKFDPRGLHPLAWASSGDVTCLAETNALIRVPANCDSIKAGAEVDFWPTTDNMDSNK